MKNNKHKKKLGKGFEALLSEMKLGNTSGEVENEEKSEASIRSISVEKITTSSFQPRKKFDEYEIQELANSIEQQGLLQPIVVREKNSKFEIVAGERRFRAIKLLGASHIDCIVKKLDDKQASSVALVENIQRKDLNVLEQSIGISKLINDFSLTHQKVADILGKSRASITNLLRILNLTDKIQLLLAQEKIDMGHAKLLLSIEDKNEQEKVAELICTGNLSVKKTDELIKRKKTNVVDDMVDEIANGDKSYIRVLQNSISNEFKNNIKITGSKNKGKVVLKYISNQQLELIAEAIKKIL